MTKAQLKAAIALAEQKGLPDSAIVTFDGAPISAEFNIVLGQYHEPDPAAPGAAEAVIAPPSFGLLHLA